MALVEMATEHFGRLDVLVSNAGLARGSKQKELTMRFSGKNVLVTGAPSGVGREAAKLFAQHGAAVTVTGRDEARGHAVVDELATASTPARFIAADLNVPDEVRRLIRDAGPVDILVNNAGFWELAPTEDTTEAGFDAMFAINVKAPFLLTAAYAPRDGGKRRRNHRERVHDGCVPRHGWHGRLRCLQGSPGIADPLLGHGIRTSGRAHQRCRVGTYPHPS